MIRSLNPDELNELEVEYDIDSYIVLAESLSAFKFPPSMKITFNQTTKPCQNKKLLRYMREEYGLTHYREFHLGGSGDFVTYVLVMGTSSIPVGSKLYFLNRGLRDGLAKLPLTSKTINHGFPTGCHETSEHVRLFAEDADIVFHELDAFIKGERERADPSNNFANLRFFYYRAKHGIIATADVVIATLRDIIADDVHVKLVQLHFGCVVGHDTLPIITNATEARKTIFKSAKEIQYYRCYNSMVPTHMTAQLPFGQAEKDCVYFQSYNPSFHAIKRMVSANPTLYYIFGQYKNCNNYIKRKVGFNEYYIPNIVHFAKLIKNKLTVRLEIVRNYGDLEDGLNALNNRHGERDHLFNIFRVNSCFGTFQLNWVDHIESTIESYIQHFQNQLVLWEETHLIGAVTEMYDAEIKIKYFLEGVAKNLDYHRLTKLLGGKPLSSSDVNDQQILTYTHNIHTDIIKFDKLLFFRQPIPLGWFKDYTKIFLQCCDKYDIQQQPTLVYLKAVARMCLLQYGPRTKTWTRPDTNDLGKRHITYLLRYRRRNFRERDWRITGTTDPKCVWAALSSPTHSGLQMFLSAVKDHENFSLPYLKRYVYTKIDYFPAYLITKHLRNMKIWYRVKFIGQHDEETDDDDDSNNDSNDDDNDDDDNNDDDDSDDTDNDNDSGDNDNDSGDDDDDDNDNHDLEQVPPRYPAYQDSPLPPPSPPPRFALKRGRVWLQEPTSSKSPGSSAPPVSPESSDSTETIDEESSEAESSAAAELRTAVRLLSTSSSSDQNNPRPSTSSIQDSGHVYTEEEESLILRFALNKRNKLKNNKTWNEASMTPGLAHLTPTMIRRRFLKLKCKPQKILIKLGLSKNEIKIIKKLIKSYT
ncbi:unnamed protein product [Psylliodes chrysocephalus]|uniref:Uncharacterized protein n=1 Tax=Psylliodes chrysocephalus TaxID=3402493 RepID=A0A9P0GCC1_9CUCU|nr:unnamed protein product [Psylliodes chrysocephala]